MQGHELLERFQIFVGIFFPLAMITLSVMLILVSKRAWKEYAEKTRANEKAFFEKVEKIKTSRYNVLKIQAIRIPSYQEFQILLADLESGERIAITPSLIDLSGREKYFDPWKTIVEGDIIRLDLIKREKYDHHDIICNFEPIIVEPAPRT